MGYGITDLVNGCVHHSRSDTAAVHAVGPYTAGFVHLPRREDMSMVQQHKTLAFEWWNRIVSSIESPKQRRYD